MVVVVVVVVVVGGSTPLFGKRKKIIRFGGPRLPWSTSIRHSATITKERQVKVNLFYIQSLNCLWPLNSAAFELSLTPYLTHDGAAYIMKSVLVIVCTIFG